METTHSSKHQHSPKGHYKRFLLMILLSFIAMYWLMYAMVDSFQNVIHNLNQAYMAALMTAPMVIIEIALMWKMYPNRKFNLVLLAFGVLLFIGSFMGIRKQSAISDKQFLKSMIPHHAGAILMVKEAELRDTAVLRLAREIIDAQEKEISFMKEKLKELDNK